MDYTNLLKRSWEIVWNNKFMFVLGFLAALGSGGGSGSGNSNFNFSSSDFGNNDVSLPPGFAENIERFWAEFAVLIFILIGLFIILGITFWIFSLIGQTGLISSAARIDAGEEATLSQAISTGMSKLGSMVGLNLLLFGPFFLIGLAAFIIVLATVGPAVVAEYSGSTGNIEGILGFLGSFAICFGLLACLLVPLGILVNIIYPFATRGLVLQEHGIVESVRHGWHVVRANVADVLILIVIFIVIGIGFGIVAAIILVPIALLIFLPAILSMINSGTLGVGNIIFLVIGGIVLGLLGAAVNSIMLAFRSTAVTLAYQEFVNKSAVYK